MAGRNFGWGSSREFAPLVIQEAGIKAVVPRSYALEVRGQGRDLEKAEEVRGLIRKWKGLENGSV